MALNLQDPSLARRRLFRSIPTQSQAANYNLAMTLLSWLMQNGGRPQLQVVEHDRLSDSEVVIMNAACSLIAWLQIKATATASYSKATDSATTSSDAASELRVKNAGAGNVSALLFPKGLAFANGITCQGNTTPSGGAASSTDGAAGVFLLAASGYAIQ